MDSDPGVEAISFIPTPSELVFKSFQPHTTYRQIISFRNTYSVGANLNVKPIASKYFTVKGPLKKFVQRKIAPGLEVQYEVSFNPDKIQDYEDRLEVETDFGNFEIPIYCVNDGVNLDLPERIVFTKCPVKYRSTDTVYIQNKSETMGTKFKLHCPEPFSVTPQELNLGPMEGHQIQIHYSPIETGENEAELEIYHDNGDYETVPLFGTCRDTMVRLSVNELELPDTFIEKLNQKTFAIINKSKYKLDFKWKKFSSAEDDHQTMMSTVQNEKLSRYFNESDLLFDSDVFSIHPLEGDVWPNSKTIVTVDFHPEVEGQYEDIIAWCDIAGRESRLPITLSGYAKGADIKFSHTTIDLGDIYINTTKSVEVFLENRGSIDAEYTLVPPKSIFGQFFSFTPSSGLIRTGDVEIIKINACCKTIGEFSETFYWNISGSESPTTIHFSGRIIGPTFYFDRDFIDFGVVSFNFVNTEYLSLENSSDIPMKYRLRIPEDGSLLNRDFDIVPSIGTVPANGIQRIKVQLLSNSLKEYAVNMVIDIEDVGESLVSIPIRAKCEVPEVGLSMGNINFGDCFINHEYHQTVELTNNSEQPAKFEVVLPSVSDKAELSVDQTTGIVPSQSEQNVKFSLKVLKSGTHFVPLYVRVLGSSNPPYEVAVQAKGIGPLVTASFNKLDFGKVSVLVDHTHELTITNKSPIPASVTLSNKSPTFRCLNQKFDLEPETSEVIQIVANLDEAMRFSDDLLVSSEGGNSFKVKMVAFGKGSSLIPSMDLKTIDFTSQFTQRKCQIPFIISNKGRKEQSIQWQFPSKKKDDTEPEVFSIEPDRATIASKSHQEFVVTGYSDSVGQFEREMFCKIARQKDNLFETVVKCNFTIPLVKLSEKTLQYEYMYSAKRLPSIQKQPLVIKNVSPIDLKFSIRIQPPFSLAQVDYLLKSEESVIANVMFDPTYRGDLLSHNVKQKLTIVYEHHAQKDTVGLVATISYPNLTIPKKEINFGTVLNHTEKRKYLKMLNNGKTEAEFNFEYLLDSDENTEVQNVFDILPIRGKVPAGEGKTIEFIYRGSENQSFKSIARCVVSGGPTYDINLQAESSLINYEIDTKVLDFGAVSYDILQEREITIRNASKVEFPFEVDLSTLTRQESIEVIPQKGYVRAGGKAKIRVKFFAGVPEAIDEHFNLRIDNFDPERIRITAVSMYPVVDVNLERDNDELYLKCLETAKDLYSRKETLDSLILERFSKDIAEDAQAPPLREEYSIVGEAQRQYYTSYLHENPLLTKRIEFVSPSETPSRSFSAKSTLQQPKETSGDTFSISTYYLDFGNIIKDTSKKMKFTLSNIGFCPVSINVDKKVLNRDGIKVDPNQVSRLPEYPSNQSQTFEISLSTKDTKHHQIQIGQYEYPILFTVENGPNFTILARANVVLPEVKISDTHLDFGKIYVGYSRIVTIQLVNEKPTPTEWFIEVDKSGINPLNFIPSIEKGVLQPNESVNIPIQFTPTLDGTFDSVLKIRCTNNPTTQKITCHGCGRELKISLSDSSIDMGSVFPKKIIQKTVEISNDSDIAVELFSLNFDEKHKQDAAILQEVGERFKNGAILVEPLQAGAGLPAIVMEEYEKVQAASESNGEDAFEPESEAEQPRSASPQKETSVRTIPPLYMVVYGPPMVGKTTVATQMSKELGRPLLQPSSFDTTDDVKEFLSSQYPSGFVLDGLQCKGKTEEEVADLVLSNSGESIVYFVCLTCDELLLQERFEKHLETQKIEEISKSQVEKLSEDRFEELSLEEQKQYQKNLRTLRTLNNQLKLIQEKLGDIQHSRRDLNESAEDILNNILRRAEEEANSKKKPKKGEVIEDPYEIKETDDEFTKFIKEFKRSFTPLYNQFQYPSGEPQKKKGKQPVDDVKRTQIVNVAVSSQDLTQQLFDSFEQLQTLIQEEEPEDNQVFLSIPEPVTRQIISIPPDRRPSSTVEQFSIIQKVEKEPEPEVNKKKKDPKKKAVEEPKDVYEKASRWVIPPRSKQSLLIQFIGSSTGRYSETLEFGVTHRPSLHYQITCNASCEFPQISTDYGQIFRSCKKSKQTKLLPRKFYVAENEYNFGPLLIPTPAAEDEKKGKDAKKGKNKVDKSSEDVTFQDSEKYKDKFTIYNIGSFETKVNFYSAEKEEETFIVEPQSFSIGAGEHQIVSLVARPKKNGPIFNTLHCCVQDNPIPFSFNVGCIGTYPEIEIDQLVVDFGKLLLTSSSTKKRYTIRNKSSIPVRWSLEGLDSVGKEFSIEPQAGVLPVNGKQTVTISFLATEPVELTNTFIVNVSDEDNLVQGHPQEMKLIAEAYKLEVFVDQNIDLGVVKIVDGATQPIDVRNDGKYDVRYRFVIPKNLKRYFSIDPIEGILPGTASSGGTKKAAKAPKKKQVEEPSTCSLTFQTSKVTSFRDNNEIQCVFVEPETDKQLGVVNVSVSVKALFCKYSVLPAHGLNFGPLNFGKEKTKEFEILNTGAFDIEYKLERDLKSRPGTARAGKLPAEAAKEVDNKKQAAKKDAKKGKKEKEPAETSLTIGPYTITPESGVIGAGSKAIVRVNFAATGNGSSRDAIRIKVKDTKPTNLGTVFDLQGETCVPGMNTEDFDSIFEEQQVVQSISSLTDVGFGINERVFSFGTKAANSESVEAIRITNPTKVPTNIEITVEEQSKEEKQKKGKGTKQETQQSSIFRVEPTNLFIPSHEHRYVKIFFEPKALSRYSSLFKAIVSDGQDPKTKELSFELRGESSLPQISIVSPAEEENKRIIKFPRLLAGRNASVPVILRNDGVLPTTVKFGLDFTAPTDANASAKKGKGEKEVVAPVNQDPDSIIFEKIGQEIIIQPKQSQKFNISFEPKSETKIHAALNLFVMDNHFEDSTIEIIGESYEDDLTFEDLPPIAEEKAPIEQDKKKGKKPDPKKGKQPEPTVQDILSLGDCPVGVEKSVNFVLENHSKDHWRFDWEAPAYLVFKPAFGHIHAKSSKNIQVSFLTDEPKDISDVVKLVSKRIQLFGSIQEWDETFKSVKWIEVEDKPPVPVEDEKAGKKNAQKGKKKKEEPPKQVTPTSPPKMITKRVEEVDPEPKHEILEGEALVKHLQCQGNADYAKVELVCDDSIHFAETNLFTERSVTIQLKNIGRVTCNYNWEFLEYENSPFVISPSKGTLESNQAQSFTLVFAPKDVDLHEETLQCEIDNLANDIELKNIKIMGQSICPVVHFELTPSDYLSSGRRDPELPGPDGKFGELSPETRVVEIQSCGVKIRNSKRFYILNPTDHSYKFFWKQISLNNQGQFGCNVTRGIIHSTKKSEIVFDYLPKDLETKESFWEFSIPEKNIKVPFIIVGSASEPQIYLDKPRINFKTVLVGGKAKAEIRLINREKIGFSFALEKSAFKLGSDTATIIKASPSSGTIPGQSEQVISVVFKPRKEQSYNFNLVCRVKKKPNPLSCNIKGEGFSVHDQLIFGDSNQTLTPQRVNNLDFGQVQINDTQIKTIELTNNGNYNYDFQWEALSHPSIRIEPIRGTVQKRSKLQCKVFFSPTRPVKIQNFSALCKVTNGKSYSLNISAEGIRPNINFSWKEFNFGPRFVHHQGSKPNETVLMVTNDDSRPISFDIDFENTDYLELDAASTVLKPGDSKKIKITFRPRNLTQYGETIIFNINGLYNVPIRIFGEGTPVRIDSVVKTDTGKIKTIDTTVHPAKVNFGALEVNQSDTKSISIMNKSKIPCVFAFSRELTEYLLKNFVSVPIKEYLLPPGHVETIPITFNPKARLQTFTEDLIALVEGQQRVIARIVGSCQGLEVKFNNETVSFGMVVIGTRVTQKIILENNGDLAAKFSFNSKQYAPLFSIHPEKGIVAPNEEQLLEVTYAPRKIKSTKIGKVECNINHRLNLNLTITGTCVKKPSENETLTFKVPVRGEEVKAVVVENPTKDLWQLKPQIDNQSWTGDDYLEVPPNGKAEYRIIFAPKSMAKDLPRPKKIVDAEPPTQDPKKSKKKTEQPPEEDPNEPVHTGSLFFPLPNGKALMYQLEGKTDVPESSGTIETTLSAKESKFETLTIKNWLKATQSFIVSFAFDSLEAPNYIKGSQKIDVPALAQKTYKFEFKAFTEGMYSGKIKFTNPKTKEYLFYVVKYKVGPPQTIETIELATPVRQKIEKTLTIDNPLPEEVEISTSCSESSIQIAPSTILPANSTSKIPFTYFPLVATENIETVDLILKNEKLGTYPFKLKLNPTPSAPEKNLHFDVPLGSSQSQSIRFTHYLPQAADYQCSFENDDGMFSTEQKAIKASAATEPSQLSLNITFEPTKMGKFKNKLLIQSKTAGDYSFILFGHCQSPSPQGPFEIAPNGSVSVPFKNVDLESVEYLCLVSPSDIFSVKPDRMAMKPKTNGQVSVSFKPKTVGVPVHGKLEIVSKDNNRVRYVFYLMGKTGK